jgi:hypothetical protein
MLLGSAGRQGISSPESRSIPRLDGAVAANPYWPAGARGLPRCSSGAGSRSDRTPAPQSRTLAGVAEPRASASGRACRRLSVSRAAMAPERWPISGATGKPLHGTERAKQVTVHYRWHPLYGPIARVRRGVPRSTGDVRFCELPDGATGALPAWMTDAAAYAALTVGAPVVSIAALQELRELLGAVVPRARVQATGASGAGNCGFRRT